MTHIICFHLFNDYSGSPKVLKMALEGMLREGYRVDLVTSRGGVLDELQGVGDCHLHHYSYHFSTNPLVTMLRYAAVQALSFCWALRWAFARNVTFYINTLLPVGPALAGRLTGKRVVYHYHENATVKGMFYQLLAAAMQRLAHRIICVSEYQASFLKRRDKVTVVPNALPWEFVEKLHPDAEAAFERKTVLMLSSLKAYKGTKEFIEMSQRMPEYRFVLVINDTKENIDKYLVDNELNGGQFDCIPKTERRGGILQRGIGGGDADQSIACHRDFRANDAGGNDGRTARDSANKRGHRRTRGRGTDWL